jgi:hypothetical protein
LPPACGASLEIFLSITTEKISRYSIMIDNLLLTALRRRLPVVTECLFGDIFP